ncbi:MAG: hypothetical protein LBS68_02990, partial [Puniceicoccales bacterium]|nr:hypothetical protein [Puniceicoccales bacterium]
MPMERSLLNGRHQKLPYFVGNFDTLLCPWKTLAKSPSEAYLFENMLNPSPALSSAPPSPQFKSWLVGVCTCIPCCAIIGASCGVLAFWPVNISLLFDIVTIDILALIIIILFVIWARNYLDAPEFSDEKEISPPADVPPPDPQPNEPVVVDAPPQNPVPIYVGVNAILRAFDRATRNQVRSVNFVNRGEGVNFKAEITIEGRGYDLIFESIQDVDTVFPEMKRLTFIGMAPDNLVLDDFEHRKFRKLENIIYSRCINSGPVSLTLRGMFDSLEFISFRECDEMRTLVFSGEHLTAIKCFSISFCDRLVDVTGIWDGGNPLLGRNSFKELTIDSAPHVNIANLNTWLIQCATKCDLNQNIRSTRFNCQNNGREILVNTDRRDLKPSDLNALTDMLITTAHCPSMTDIPFRKNTQQTWNINVRSSSRHSIFVLKFEGPGNVANAEGVFPRNVTATDEINTENISNFQMKI